MMTFYQMKYGNFASNTCSNSGVDVLNLAYEPVVW